jgi:hypothetical protein
MYREFCNFVDWFTVTGAQPAAGHMNFADESACLMVNNIWNEGK